MAGKRSATSDLNHNNWDKEEEPEDSGTFLRASEESLKTRVFKTAKRRNPISSVRDNGDNNEKKSAFTNFGGFGKAQVPTTSAFSFLSNITTTATPTKVNGVENKEKTPISTFKFSSTTENKTTGNKTLNWTHTEKSSANIFTLNSTANNNNKSTNSPQKSNTYYSKLKGLNQSVSNWIKQHVDANPLINLQPIFKDYEKYFKEIEKDKDAVEPGESSKPIEMKSGVDSSATAFVFKPTTSVPDSTTEKNQLKAVEKVDTDIQKSAESAPPKFSFGSSVTSTATTAPFSFGNKTGTGTFSFGKSATTEEVSKTTSSSSTSFKFGQKPASSTTPSFTGSTPFTFENVVKPTSTENVNKDGEEDEEPPKNEFTPVIEKDHVYTTRCKVFVKKDEQFGDRGVGNLFLKPVENSDKVQLIVRADTNLGNLLLNLILSVSIPTKRLGKKDVMLVCIPTPEATPPPVPVLIRVKNGKEADALLETLEKYKK